MLQQQLPLLVGLVGPVGLALADPVLLPLVM